MALDDFDLDQPLKELWSQLKQLNLELRTQAKSKYDRVNPFTENLFDWQEKSRFLNSPQGTVYDSATIIGQVTIGANTWVGPFTCLDGSGGLSIGSFCSISMGVQILTHDSVKWALSGGREAYEHQPVSIGDCCFIGVDTVILRGSKIGDHCLIGANSLVNSEIASYSIAVGSPARVIGKVAFDDEGKVKLKFFK